MTVLVCSFGLSLADNFGSSLSTLFNKHVDIWEAIHHLIKCS